MGAVCAGFFKTTLFPDLPHQYIAFKHSMSSTTKLGVLLFFMVTVSTFLEQAQAAPARKRYPGPPPPIGPPKPPPPFPPPPPPERPPPVWPMVPPPPPPTTGPPAVPP